MIDPTKLITDLDPASYLQGGDYFIVDQNNVTKKVTLDSIKLCLNCLNKFTVILYHRYYEGEITCPVA